MWNDDEEDEYDISTELEGGISKAIENWYNNNEMRIVIVEGYTGVGKSVYALLTASYIYKTWDWNKLKNYFIYDPIELDEKSGSNASKRKPLLIWDDAGAWLNNKDYKDRWVKEACKYFQTARTEWGCIMLTTVDAENIVRDIREMKGRILIQCMKNSSKRQPNRRLARIFTKWKTPDKKRQGEENHIDEDFYLHHCDRDCYSEYEIYRRSFARKARRKMKEYRKDV